MNLKKGDTIGIISPSWCGPQFYPQVYHAGIKNIKEMGFQIKEYEFTTKQGSPEEKAQDIHEAFSDPETQAIICTIGGDDAMLSLPYLDIELIKKHKKPIMGYSDSSTLFAYLAQHNIPCFHGPTIMAGFAQLKEFPEWATYVEQVLLENKNEFKPFSYYCDGYASWDEHPSKVEGKKQNNGFHFLNSIEGEGKLYGGCIEVLEFLKGTKYFPQADFWNDKVLFFETSEDKPSVNQVKYFLRNYGLAGILSRIKGLLFGRPRDYTEDEKEELEKVILEILNDFKVKIPVITNMDFGHTDPQLILPYIRKVKITKSAIFIVERS